MESVVARQSEKALVEATQRLTPEERLDAFLTHCRLMMDLYHAGEKIRATHPKASPRASPGASP